MLSKHSHIHAPQNITYSHIYTPCRTSCHKMSYTESSHVANSDSFNLNQSASKASQWTGQEPMKTPIFVENEIIGGCLKRFMYRLHKAIAKRSLTNKKYLSIFISCVGNERRCMPFGCLVHASQMSSSSVFDSFQVLIYV